MTSICCISDCHLGYRHRLKVQRLKDYEASFNEALDSALKLSPSLLIFGGDILHHTRPDPKSMQVLIKRLITAADSVPCIFCIGNHEIETNLSSSYTPIFSDLHKNVHVLTTENPHILLELDGKRVGVHGFQFTRDRKMAEENLEKITAEVSDNDVDILCLHQAVEGYLEPHELSLSALRSVADKYDLILSGHVHKHQILSEMTDVVPAYYIGSTERVSFNESNNVTGFLAFKDMDFAHPKFVPVDSAPMRVVKADLGKKTPAEVNSRIKQLIEENPNIKCLQISVSVDVVGDYFDIVHDWESVYPNFTILDVSVSSTATENHISLDRLEISEAIFDEYFEKTGMGNRTELKEMCRTLFRKYGA
jgi:DNA repair exonuclease SbcCD nuclease subunit